MFLKYHILQKVANARHRNRLAPIALQSMRVIGVFNYENRVNKTSELHHLMSYHFLRIKDEHTSLRLLYIV